MSGATMRAWVLAKPGGPEALEFRTVPRPTARPGWVLIRVRAFGLNRSEWFTRRGDSSSVKLPRVLGIEGVGEVVDAPGSLLQPGQTVAAMMGGMGRQFDGPPSSGMRPSAASMSWNTTQSWEAGIPWLSRTWN